MTEYTRFGCTTCFFVDCNVNLQILIVSFSNISNIIDPTIKYKPFLNFLIS